MGGKRVKIKNVWGKEVSQDWCIRGENGEYGGSLLVRIQNTDVMAFVRVSPEYLAEVAVKHEVHLWLGSEQVASFIF